MMTPITHFDPALVKIEPACKYLDVGRSKLYELIREGKLDAVKIGKSARITTASLKRFVESLPASPGGSPIKRANAPSLEDRNDARWRTVSSPKPSTIVRVPK
jgi:excisionase family DNA binding protein